MSGRNRGLRRSRLPGVLTLAAALFLSLFLGTGVAEELELSAESIEHASDTNVLTASGRVTLRLEGLEAQGESLEADLERHLVRMPGPVSLTTSAGTLTGENLQYAWDQQQGSLEQVETVNQGIRLSGREADVSPDKLVLRGSLFTKCLLPTPEYAFQAREVEVDPGKQVATARGVTLALFGHRLLPLPNLRFSLKDTPVGRMSRERLPIPTVGYDSDRGYFVHEEVPTHLSDQSIALVGAGYGTKEGGRVTLTALHAPSPSTTYRLNARFRQRTPEGSAATAGPDLDGMFEFSALSAIGQLTVTAEERDDEDHRGKDLTFLPRVELAPSPLDLGSMTLTPTLEWANIREGASAREASRGVVRLAWSASPRLPGRFTLDLSGDATQAWYGSGEVLNAGTLSVLLAHPLTADLSLETKYNYAQHVGATPFLFDEPDRYREGEIGLSWRRGADELSASVVYDLARVERGGFNSFANPAALKGTATLTAGLWRVGADLRYELGEAPHYSTLTLDLVRQLHCFELSLRLEPVEQRFSVRLALR
ncbi:MAG: hypothetical protein QME79_00490 [Bacillota bacterium]|nr:hypothetical protein [Bacillota bacterium]